MRRNRPDRSRLRGTVVWELRGPDGEIRASGTSTNLITQVGDTYYGERAADITGPPAQVTGMKLGQGSEAPSKTGAGAALDTYLTDSDQAIDGSFPTSSLSSGSRRVTWEAVWAPGKATTASPITEVVLVNDALADSTSTEANTISRALLSNISAKGSGDTLTITWHHDLLGSN